MPLDTATATAAGTWAAVVMGGSAAQHNNFWDLFGRPAGSTRWKLVTPPGTADNGGLVLAAGTGEQLITGFRPSQYLTYTPLTQTSNLGHTWSALSPLNAPLASTPDALAVQPATGALLALLSSGTAEQGTPGGATWRALVTARALAATPAGRSCGLRALTAVTYTPAGAPLLAGTCSRPGVAGIFEASGHTWQAAGPALTGALAGQPVTVLRLSTTGSQITVLLAAGSGHRTTLIAASSADSGGTWTLSPPFTASAQTLTVSSLGPGQTAAVITADGRGAVLADDRWQQLPALPAGTAALAPGTGGETDALTVHRSTLTVWQLTSPVAPGPGHRQSTSRSSTAPRAEAVRAPRFVYLSRGTVGDDGASTMLRQVKLSLDAVDPTNPGRGPAVRIAHRVAKPHRRGVTRRPWRGESAVTPVVDVSASAPATVTGLRPAGIRWSARFPLL